ncbi:MAG: ribonuclease HI [Ginsengibacter sp.]
MKRLKYNSQKPIYKMTPSQIRIYTDGASRGNPGRGGYGVIMTYGKIKKELSQGYRQTTNNRMELMAVIAALEALKKDALNITIYSDSNYVVKAIMEGWLNKWMRTNFRGNIKNQDLWVQYFTLAKRHHVHVIWVKGHADNIMNNRCDELATLAADGNDLVIDEGYEEANPR